MTGRLQERYDAMDATERAALRARFDRYVAGDRAAVTFDDAELLVALADGEVS